MLSVKTFEGLEGENLLLWIREVEMAMGCALLKSQHQRVALAIPKLSGRAREWALTSGSSVDQAFPTWDEIEQQLSRVLSPPNHAYRVRSKFLTTRQGKKDLAGYVQELRALIAGMVAQPLPESVTVTVFMDGLRTGVVRTEVFRNHPTTFEEAMAVALNTEYNFKSARMVWSASQTLPPSPWTATMLKTKDLSFELLCGAAVFADISPAEHRPLEAGLSAAEAAICSFKPKHRFGPRRGAACWGRPQFY
ncbi:hypothetical protein ON010_g7944 [Phytophthora cinnamomi]|nr:hypothetical protein ON010_g7944 [Phytophthora cinnamomi]